MIAVVMMKIVNNKGAVIKNCMLIILLWAEIRMYYWIRFALVKIVDAPVSQQIILQSKNLTMMQRFSKKKKNKPVVDSFYRNKQHKK